MATLLLVTHLNHVNCGSNMRFAGQTLFLTILVSNLNAAQDSATIDRIDFSQQIEPILADRCYKCHGPDEGPREADLRLDQESSAKDYVIVPGDPEASELLQRISASGDERMPPPDSKLSLTGSEIELIRRWIAEGAEWKKHWAFEPPGQVAVPDSEGNWAINEIDQFVLKRMREHGLQPSRPASRETLIRRATFDITGLPPTLDEIDQFLTDDSADAFEKVVDRLLASSRYGERIASIWLDAARYSDTYGYQVDRERFVWPWRDWVVQALNDNMPYDQFLTWQIAGDLLPNATRDQILATTFNRLHPQKVEGGSVPEEFRVEYVADRTQTFATAFLGLTLECARCHDHKYDPISQREYYQLFAYFNNIDEAGLYSFFTPAVPTPTLFLADESSEKDRSEAEAKIVAALEARDAAIARSSQGFQEWFVGHGKELAASIKSSSLPGQIAFLDFENVDPKGNEIVTGQNGFGKALQLSGDDEFTLEVGNFRRFQPFSVSLRIRTPDHKERAVVFHRSRAWTDAGSRGYQLLIEDGKLSASLIHFWPGNAIRVRTQQSLPPGQWVHVCMVYDGMIDAKGLEIFIDGRRVTCDTVRNNLYKNITGGGGDNISIGARFRDRGFTGGQVDDFRVFDRQLCDIEVAQLFDGKSLVDALCGGFDQLDHQTKRLLQQFYGLSQDPKVQIRQESLVAAQKQLCDILDATNEIMVMREMLHPRPAFVLHRGHYEAHREPVQAGVPRILSMVSTATVTDRLGLAGWATDPAHPLTSRVAVNRLWQICFGTGLVRSPEDFGSQGSRPTHPQLLDWLATDFVAAGWDVKRSIKQIVMSATYRQSSDFDKQKTLADPENRWLSRSPVYRLPAEMVRDNALAVSGLLVDKIGGPPARPYELEASFKPIAKDDGEGLYRRSLYTYWKRTGPAPVMMTLDAAKRDVCRLQREKTSTPLQALVLMNAPQFVEASRVLAAKSLESSEGSTQVAIEDVFRVLTSRRADSDELRVLIDLFNSQKEYFANQPQAASQLLQVGHAESPANHAPEDLAALAVVTNTLMNFDECVMKR